MNWRMALMMAASALLTAGCGNADDPVPASTPVVAEWRRVATAADRDRIAGWYGSWTEALAKARASGHADAIEARGRLLDPDAGLQDPALPEGDYACAVTKLGARGSGMLDYIEYPAFRCRVSRAGGRLLFEKVGGSQRPSGRLYPDQRARMILLGTMMLGDEAMPMAYGADPDRDVAGIVERIGPERWRIVFPAPRWESLLDVVSLEPIG